MNNLLETKKFRQKDQILKRIGMDYKKVKYNNPDVFMVSEKEEFYLEKSKEYYKNNKEKVDYILIQMDPELSRVIYNEYLVSNNGNWWVFNYSKSTYYRLKNKAMNIFFEWWYA